MYPQSQYAPPPDPAFDPVLDAPGGGEQRVLASEVTVGRPAEESVPEAPAVSPVTLDDVERARFTELIGIGRRSKVIDVYGHSVEVTTLNVDDDLRVSQFTRDYRDSDGYGRAYQLATCAAAIRTVDGKPLYTPLSTEEPPESTFAAKVAVLSKYTPLVLSRIFNEQVKLDAEAADLLEKLGKSTG